MTLEEISFLAETVAAIAVVFGLVFVGVQVRQGAEATRRATANELAAGRYSTMMATVENEGMAEIWVKGIKDFAGLTEVERLKLTVLLNNIFASFVDSYRARQRGLLDAEMWQGTQRVALELFALPGVQVWWQFRKHWHPEPFRRWLEEESAKAAIGSDPRSFQYASMQ